MEEPIANLNLPVILVGDFNADLSDDREQLFGAMHRYDFKVQFHMRWSTYKERVASDFDKGGVVKRTIDYAMCRGKVHCLSFIDAPTEPLSTLPTANDPSDHLPLVADFVVF